MTHTPVATVGMVAIDAPDAPTLAQFYSAVLGWPIAQTSEEYALLSGPGFALGISSIPDYVPPTWPDNGHKQFHLCLAAEDVDAMVARCVELGARRPDEQPGEQWVVLVDPAGHPFCISDATFWSGAES